MVFVPFLFDFWDKISYIYMSGNNAGILLSFNNGVLELRIPKKEAEEVEPRKIQIA